MQIFTPDNRARSIAPIGLMLAFTCAQAQTDAGMPLLTAPADARKDSNDLTARSGGWRIYAREAQQPEKPPAAPADELARHHGGR